ncbi:MAG: BCD family MFS transporter [Beijerinckiaceae bacterium]|nr:BCD family MFS transporter [Beijerinckiaceae bacterium]
MNENGLSWFGIVRLGLVQTSIGAMVVLSTSTINRLMVVEFALPALVPGILVTWHYLLQIMRPRWGHGSDVGGRRTPWIIGGMAVLALGGFISALSIDVMAYDTSLGLLVAALAFTLIGAGVGAAGTSLLVLLAKSVKKERRAAAATIVWIMMIAGFVMTAGFVGKFLNPFSADRLILIAAIVCLGGFALSSLSLFRLETTALIEAAKKQTDDKPDFKVALAEVWQDQTARRFAIFIFVSMLAYSAQELVLEPFGALVFGMSPSETALLGGAQHGGALAGMILVGTLATLFSKSRIMALRNWIIVGCAGSALALMGLVAASRIGPAWPLVPSIFALGLANGIYAVAAIGSMFNLAASGGEAREGLRMGLFGAAQGVAFGIGGFAGSGLSDLMRLWLGSPVGAYSIVFAVEGILFLSAAFLAAQIGQTSEARDDSVAFHHQQKAQMGISGG